MPAIAYTSRNLASKNIAEVLHSFCPRGVEIVDERTESVLDIQPLESDYTIVLSSHKSKTAQKLITAHHPGNWGAADMGGEARTLNIACGSRIKDFIKKANEEKNRRKMDDWSVVMEVDHHGPTPRPQRPLIFVEIGSTESEWRDRSAAEVVAEGVVAMISNSKEYESVFGVGGGHYAKEFTEILLKTEYAVGHILPKYKIDEVDEDVLKQAIEKNVERVKKVFLLKDQTNVRQKEKIRLFCNKNDLIYCEV